MTTEGPVHIEFDIWVPELIEKLDREWARRKQSMIALGHPDWAEDITFEVFTKTLFMDAIEEIEALRGLRRDKALHDFDARMSKLEAPADADDDFADDDVITLSDDTDGIEPEFAPGFDTALDLAFGG